MNKNLDKAIKAIKSGSPIILVDEEDREFEGDLVLAAEKVNFFNLQFLFLHGRGLMCLPCNQSKLDQFKIPMMHSNSNDKFATPFATSIDAVKNVTTGMSLNDRLITINTFNSEKSVPNDLSQPGHLFPLRASKNLLLDRQGHTEGTVELLRLSGLNEVGIIIEIMDWQGEMVKGESLFKFSKLYDLPIVSIDEVKDEIYH